jgi:hypothetical protein
MREFTAHSVDGHSIVADAISERRINHYARGAPPYSEGMSSAISYSEWRIVGRPKTARGFTALALGFLLPNGCLQQIAANRFSIPQDVIAILLQGFVRHVLGTLSRNAPGSGSTDLGAAGVARNSPLPRKHSRDRLFDEVSTASAPTTSLGRAPELPLSRGLRNWPMQPEATAG